MQARLLLQRGNSAVTTYSEAQLVWAEERTQAKLSYSHPETLVSPYWYSLCFAPPPTVTRVSSHAGQIVM
ncbi:hypothetical protein E2C01_092856 [Portunus trituberculatus]|uniref:Uncharacterized protein n=1 Tax=Portunus trituberculatus TaxID=210409 RepID=A0A5B7JWK4_PORTR|nr:hypothetical protein [Portunus trituberculatus]